MKKKGNSIGIFVVFTSVLSVVASLLANVANTKQQEAVIEEKIEEALSEREE